MSNPTPNFCRRTRREFLWEAGAGFSGIALVLLALLVPHAAAQELPQPKLPKGKAEGSSPVIPLRMIVEDRIPQFDEKAKENKKKYGEVKDFPDLAKAEWALLATLKDFDKRDCTMKLTAQIVVDGTKYNIRALNEPSLVGESHYTFEVTGLGKVNVELKGYPGSALITDNFFPNEGIAHTQVGLSVDVTLRSKAKFGWSFAPEHKFVIYANRLVDAGHIHLWDTKKHEIIIVPANE